MSFTAEGQQIGVATGDVHGVWFNSPCKGVGRLIHIAAGTTEIKVISPQMFGTVNKNELLRRSSNNASCNDGRWYCEDPIIPSGASITPNVPADYFPHTTRSWRLQTQISGGAISVFENADTTFITTKVRSTRFAALPRHPRLRSDRRG